MVSKTQENLLKAFTGESQARNKYNMFAKMARKENLEWIANDMSFFKRNILIFEYNMYTDKIQFSTCSTLQHMMFINFCMFLNNCYNLFVFSNSFI